MIEKTDWIWMDGKFMPWEEANIHILSHVVHYASGVFEGIRCYETDNKTGAIFRLDDHIKRFFNSWKILGIFDKKIPFSENDIFQPCIDIMRRNNLKEAYIRPIMFLGQGDMGLDPQDNPIRAANTVWPWPPYLGKKGLKEGVTAGTVSVRRPDQNSSLVKAKAIANYVNSMRAKREAKLHGYDEALVLDKDGYVAEGSAMNIFIVKDRVLKTPPLSAPILAGITRGTVITLAKQLGFKVLETLFSLEELYIADEAFFTGTAAEVTPIRKADGRVIGKGQCGPITGKLQKLYFDIVRGKFYHWKNQEAQIRGYQDWLTYI